MEGKARLECQTRFQQARGEHLSDKGDYLIFGLQYPDIHDIARSDPAKCSVHEVSFFKRAASPDSRIFFSSSATTDLAAAPTTTYVQLGDLSPLSTPTNLSTSIPGFVPMDESAQLPLLQSGPLAHDTSVIPMFDFSFDEPLTVAASPVALAVVDTTALPPAPPTPTHLETFTLRFGTNVLPIEDTGLEFENL